MSSTSSKQLQVMQNNCLRICTNSAPGTSTEELHKVAGVRRLNIRRKTHLCNLVYKGVYNQYSTGINKMFQTTSTNITATTRAAQNELVCIPKTNLHISSGYLKVRGPQYFNKIPPEIRSVTNYELFK